MFGMWIRTKFRSVLERQVGEAVAIEKEKDNEVVLRSSRSKYKI